MRDDYKLRGKTVKLDGVEVESEVLELLEKMEKHSKLSRSELANTALKRFISHHKDFLPDDAQRTPLRK
jgi:metal-responsive CopG/Arc/MetJ family transcriptional regulator